MSADLSIPVTLRLPEGWRPAPPERVAELGMGFVAVYPQPEAGFTANVSVHAEPRVDAASLADMADESVNRMREVAQHVELDGRSEIGSPEAPGVIQQLSFSAQVGGGWRELVQSQVFVAMLDVEDPAKRVVIRVTLTCTAVQHGELLEDFQEIVSSVRLDQG